MTNQPDPEEEDQDHKFSREEYNRRCNEIAASLSKSDLEAIVSRTFQKAEAERDPDQLLQELPEPPFDDIFKAAKERLGRRKKGLS